MRNRTMSKAEVKDARAPIKMRAKLSAYNHTCKDFSTAIGIPLEEILIARCSLGTMLPLEKLGTTDVQELKNMLTPRDYRIIAATIAGVVSELIARFCSENHPSKLLRQQEVRYKLISTYPSDPVKFIVKIMRECQRKKVSEAFGAAAAVLTLILSLPDHMLSRAAISRSHTTEVLEKVMTKYDNQHLLLCSLWWISISNNYNELYKQ